ncbi:hypothetical protein [Mucilaginibacter antarcticus]|uniref:hypothetical protein n=1 Tax=Mucilaginibacter antarcticus TaxID=1855725 RepID=UPI00362EEDC8
MDETQFEILPVTLVNQHHDQIDDSISAKFADLKDSELSVDSFSFYTSVSAVFSSRIEGENIELDSFVKHKLMGVQFTPDHTQKIDDLYDAYQFARQSALNADTIKQAHILLTSHILQKHQQGVLRTGNMFVTTSNGKIEYVACAPGSLAAELDKLYNDIAALISTQLTIKEVFFLLR